MAGESVGPGPEMAPLPAPEHRLHRATVAMTAAVKGGGGVAEEWGGQYKTNRVCTGLSQRYAKITVYATRCRGVGRTTKTKQG